MYGHTPFTNAIGQSSVAKHSSSLLMHVVSTVPFAAKLIGDPVSKFIPAAHLNAPSNNKSSCVQPLDTIVAR